METKFNVEGTQMTVAISGRLDTTTAPELEAAIMPKLAGITKVFMDMAELQYISSAGLRVLLSTKKKIGGVDGLVIINANDEIKEIFDITGFCDILCIQ